LQAGTVLPSAMLKRLAAFQRQNQLDLALQELGRVERTLFTLDWLESPDLRQRCQVGLNKASSATRWPRSSARSSDAASPTAARRRSSSGHRG
jgi:TnpA family transposase